mgnify:CR=1 FL=1
MDTITVNVKSDVFPSCASSVRLSTGMTFGGLTMLRQYATIAISTGAVHLQTYMTAEELADLSAACLAARDALTQTEPA